jgi:hypothetical protein
MQNMQTASMAEPGLRRVANASWALSQRHWRLVLVTMLALLHIAVFRGVTDPWARALLLAHLGLLLLWQPFLRAEQRVSPTQGFILSLVAFAVMLQLTWWFLAAWVVVLAGLVGGKVYQQHARWQRRVYLVVLGYLLALLAVVILPEIAPRREITDEVRTGAEYLLPLAFVLIALFPAEPESGEGAQVIDFFYSVFVMLLLMVVILGSFAFMTVGRTTYLEALTYTVFLTASGVLLVGLAWNPRSGVAGLNVFFARYIFSIGLPVERWLRFLTELLQMEAKPERFLAEAVGALMRLPAVSAVEWSTADSKGAEGKQTGNIVQFENSVVILKIHSRYKLGPALHWHLHLLGQVLGEFYVAKLHEERLRQASYVQAVHETGARMTHDIKNLLQSLNVLCSVAAREENSDSAELNALVRRQLPVISQRLSETLGKLQRPHEAGETFVPAKAWWEDVARQYSREGVEFEPARVPPDTRLPRVLFDSVTDNLIRNALVKRSAEGSTRVQASLECREGIQLRVNDDGSAVPVDVAKDLLRAPVASRNGLGIGLYQAARQAQAAGYALSLESNRDGQVTFVLSGPTG